jgi:cell wall-associated NlpC family hydrolase
MAASGPISGVAILLGLAGGVLVASGLRNASVADTLRATIRAQPIPSQPSQIDATRLAIQGGRNIASNVADFIGQGSGAGDRVANTARNQLGIMYRWGGHTPAGFDCSGLVSYCLLQNGIKIPSPPHTTAAGFYAWSGAVNIPRNLCAPGDLVCWVSHIGIATGRDTLVHAPTFGQRVREQNIWAGAVIRRPKAYTGT